EKSRTRKVSVEPGKENSIDLTRDEEDKTKDATKPDKKVTDTKKDGAPPLDLFPKKDAKKDGAPSPDLLPKADAKKDAEEKNGKKKPLPDDKGASAPRTREFLFTYGATVTGLRPGQTARVWVPVPPSNEDQRVRRVPHEQPFRV